MHDGSQKLVDDQSLTPEQRQAAMGELFMKADKEVRTFLNEEQKKKLDEMEAQMHGGPHDNPNENASPQH
jgi:hypothetical protein